VIDLDTQLERLAAEATRDAVPPGAGGAGPPRPAPPPAPAGRSALVVAAVLAAGLILPPA
jgi:hypothetical protein